MLDLSARPIDSGIQQDWSAAMTTPPPDNLEFNGMYGDEGGKFSPGWGKLRLLDPAEPLNPLIYRYLLYPVDKLILAAAFDEVFPLYLAGIRQGGDYRTFANEWIDRLLVTYVARRAVEDYKRDAAAIALASVTALANAAAQAAAAGTTAATYAAPPYYPQLNQPRYSLEDAAILKRISLRSLKYELSVGKIVGIYNGSRRYIMHNELMRSLARNDQTPIAPPKPPAKKKPVQKVKLLTLPKPEAL
jgi:hypothetical protein